MDHCDECGFDYSAWSTAALPAALAEIGSRAQQAISGVGVASLRQRPRPDVWSALEYACHLRDVFLAQRERLYLALVEDKPEFWPMNRDERPALARYNEQQPELVVSELDVAARLFARSCSYLTPEQWQRSCVYGYPARVERTLQWVAQHTLHEGQHHVLDITRGLSGP